MRGYFSIITILFLSNLVYAQTEKDSLWKAWESDPIHDTLKLEALNRYTWKYYMFSSPDSAFQLMSAGKNYASDKKLRKDEAAALNMMGISHAIRGNLDSALFYYDQSVNSCVTYSLWKIMSGPLNNAGSIYKSRGDYPHAIEYYTNSLKADEHNGNEIGMATSLNNIGLIYMEQEDYTKAREYFLKSLEKYRAVKDDRGIALSLNNLGLSYKNFADDAVKKNNDLLADSLYKKGLEYFEQSLEIKERINNQSGVAATLNNIGAVQIQLKNYGSAEASLMQSLEIRRGMDDKENVANTLANLGKLFELKDNFALSKKYYTEAYNRAILYGLPEETKDVSFGLYELYKKTGEYRNALDMHEVYLSARDSISSIKNQKSILQQEYDYEYEKMHLADSLDFARQKEVNDILHQADIDKRIRENYILYGGVICLFVLGIIVFFAYRNKRKDNILISEQKKRVEEQKSIIEEAHKEITDSITYAKRIQSAILPPDKLIREQLHESFVLYLPKDIVAGDFYWMEPYGTASDSEGTDKGVLFAVADCTGHGVPGAMVSVVCNNGLNRAVREYGLKKPGAILDKTRELVISEFEKSEEEVKDGMDIALCSLNLGSNLTTDRVLNPVSGQVQNPVSGYIAGKTGNAKLQYAGAHNPLWIIRKGADTIEEIKADKQPIGKFDSPIPYTTHTLALNKGDSIYIFSDGYVDQFGGENLPDGKAGGKKFKSKNFKALLLSIQDKSMDEQKERIHKAFNEWRGSIEQVDDICVIGVRI